ncbi:PAS domain-containing hybrid sensor histidine kinase/response regulator [Thalassobius sp. Cn5-15]|uniref:PAS domain-containing hybrid sensor histidine kinase/response regulator n=1 Tax=Thalassobius sp. Cn5-15 TaxID=2917763 RepID=UPI001EF31B02|nr:PAS domain S-box protein [Thalassobius sp. Cn5-15]
MIRFFPMRPARQIFVLVLLAMFVLTGLLMVEVRGRLQDLSTASTDNLQWNIAQLEVELLRLDGQIAQTRSVSMSVAQDQGSAIPPDLTLSLRQLRVRFDIFYSRVKTYETGPLYLPLWQSDENQKIMTDLGVYLRAGATLVDRSDAGLRDALAELAALTDAQKAPVRRLLLSGVARFAESSDQARADLARTLTRLAVSSLLLIAVLVLLALLLLRLLRKGRQVAAQSERVQSRLAAMASSSLDAILVVDRDGHVLEFNGAAETVFGYRRADVIGRDMADLIVPEHLRQAHRAGMARFARTGKKRVSDTGRLRLEAMRKSGETFPVELSITAAKAGRQTVFVSFLRDITQQVEAEAALKRARDEARAGEKAKADLLTVMSHEMRTPLNGILGSLELMQRDPLSKRQLRNLRAAKFSGDLLLSHVNDVLDLSRLDADAMASADPVSFDLPELVETLVASQAALAKARGNHLSMTVLSPDLQHVTGHPAALNRCLVNLVGNAVKFTENGDIAVEVERRTGSDLVEIRVSDTGAGIPEDKIDSIFQEFVTVDPSFGRRSEGTGLGLSITRRLVDQMQGEITVDSIEGEGSLFQMLLPLPAATAPMTGQAETARDAQVAPLPAGHVLLVEDNEINREILTDMLQDLGQKVTPAVDGPSGIKRAAEGGFDLILMDISMPGMDGMTALEAMRGQGNLQPALAVTAHASPEDHARILASGFCGIVTKPVSVRQLREALEGVKSGTDCTRIYETEASQLGRQTRSDFVDRMGQEKFATLMRHFASDTADLLGDLQAGTGLNADQVQNAHNLAGMAGLLGENGLQQALKGIEDLPQNAPADEVPLILPELLSEAQQMLATLKDTLGPAR